MGQGHPGKFLPIKLILINNCVTVSVHMLTASRVLITMEADSDIPVHVRVHVHDSCSRTQMGRRARGVALPHPFLWVWS